MQMTSASSKFKHRNFFRTSISINQTRRAALCTCSSTLAGLNGISTCLGEVFSQSMIFSTSLLLTWNSSQFRIADSRRILIEYGNLSEVQTTEIELEGYLWHTPLLSGNKGPSTSRALENLETTGNELRHSRQTPSKSPTSQAPSTHHFQSRNTGTTHKPRPNTSVPERPHAPAPPPASKTSKERKKEGKKTTTTIWRRRRRNGTLTNPRIAEGREREVSAELATSGPLERPQDAPERILASCTMP